MGRDDLNDLSREKLENLVCEWAIRYHELDSKMHTLENELNNRIKTQREKINSLQMELEEEKGKTITVFDGGITMRTDIWRIVDENKSLRDENKALKRRVENFEVELKSKIDNPKLHKKIIRLQDQHKQDCIRYNDIRTAYLVTLDELGRLRELFGDGR